MTPTIIHNRDKAVGDVVIVSRRTDALLTVRLHAATDHGHTTWTVKAHALYLSGTVYLCPGLQPDTLEVSVSGLQARAVVYYLGTPKQFTDLELKRLS